MGKNSNIKNIFDNASLKLQKSKILKIFVLSGILLSRGKLNCDLIAEEFPQTKIENFIPNTGISIVCEDSDEHLARNLRRIIYDLEDDNEICKILVKSLEENNISLEVCEKSDLYAGSYIIGENRILIPKNTLERLYEDKNPIDVLRIKRAIAHETTHMLQDKKGIFNDAKQLSPLDCAVVYTLAEIDAICKSYIATDNNFWDTNSAFDCLSNMIPCLDSYTTQGFCIGQLYNTKNPNITLEDTVKKFNQNGFSDYANIDDMIKITKEKIQPELMEELITKNNEYLKNQVQKQIIASQNLEKD